MSITQVYSGSAVTIGATPVSLFINGGSTTPQSVDGAKIWHLELKGASLAPADTFLLKIKKKLVSGGAQETIEERLIGYSMPEPMPVSWESVYGADATLEKLTGTDRAFTWGADADDGGGASVSAADIADAVWDEARAGHVAGGSFGEGVPVVSIAAGAVNAAAIGTDAIDADAIKADAVTEFQNGLATAAGVTADGASTRALLPGALDVSGNIKAQVKGIDAGVVTTIQSGLATLAGQATIIAAIAALSIPTAAQVRDSVWGFVMEGTETAADAVRLIGARLFGKATVQSGDGSYAYRDAADSKNRIAGTISGTARTVTTRDGT